MRNIRVLIKECLNEVNDHNLFQEGINIGYKYNDFEYYYLHITSSLYSEIIIQRVAGAFGGVVSTALS